MNYTKNDRIISVANGFNIWAFIFAWGWLLSRELWLQKHISNVDLHPSIFFPFYRHGFDIKQPKITRTRTTSYPPSF